MPSRKHSKKRSRKVSRKKSAKISRKTSKGGKLKLVKIVRSPRPEKKMRAYFSDGTHTDFGAKGMQNYGGVGKERHLDENRKKSYIQRHKSRENWSSPKTAGALSRWVLWNKDTLQKSVADYKRRFNL
jgi:hypothetical protein